MDSLQFNSFLLDISNQLSPDQLDTMKFLCRDMIGKKDMEKISSALKLFQILTERGKLSGDNTEFLSYLLKEIKRQDLLDNLDNFQSESGHTENEPEKDKLEIATELLAEKLGKNWRKLGRRLGLNDVKLESIQKRHPTDLEETAVGVMKEWRKSRRGEAQTEELLNALRACQLNWTADELEDKLLLSGN